MEHKKAFPIRVTIIDRIDVKFTKNKGRVLQFSVNYRSKINHEWKQIVRYDTAHDEWKFPHKHLYYANKKPVINYLKQKNYNDLFTFAVEEIKRDWQKYKERYFTSK